MQTTTTTPAVRLRVRDLMTAHVFAVRQNDDLLTVTELMDEHAFRHLPVVDAQSRVQGLVSQRDLLRTALRQPSLPPDVERHMLLSTTAGQIMTPEPRTIGPDEDIRRAAQIMLEHKYGCLPVVDKGRLVGILTEADFVRFLAVGE